MEKEERLTRDLQEKKYTWNLGDIFSEDSHWEQALEDCRKRINSLAMQRETFLASAEIFYLFLKDMTSLEEELGKVYAYGQMFWHQDTRNTESQNMAKVSESILLKYKSDLSFIEPAILALQEGLLDSWQDDYEPLKEYSQYIDKILRSKPYVLSEKEERIIAMASDLAATASNAFAMYNNADVDLGKIKNEKNEEVDLSHARYATFLKSDHENVRKQAFEAMHRAYKRNINTLTSIYSINIKDHVMTQRLRGFSSTCEAALFSNNIPVSVYDYLLKSIEDALPLLHRYVAIRKGLLGKQDLHMYDMYLPLVEDVDVNISFDEAKATVLEALKPMGDDYCKTVKYAFENRWLDVYENKGKRSGAYSWGVYGVHPYVLLNHENNMNSMFTLAHEIGHAMHSYYSNKTQTYQDHNYPIFLAEIASTVNENLLIRYLLKKTSDGVKRRYIINHFLEGFKSTIFRQTMFAEFERLTHEIAEKDQALSADKLSDLYYELNKKYYGPSVIHDDLIRYEWARIPHFYYNYYVFQYATGYAIAVTIAEKILNEGQEAYDNYLNNFLKLGGSKYPLEILNNVGIDILKDDPIKKAMVVFEEYLNEIDN